jgi:GNAT superfamily N-acetyltransferase
MNLQKAHEFREYSHRHGFARTLHHFAYRLLNRCFPYLTMKCICIDTQELKTPKGDFPYEGRFLETSELLEFARNEACPGSGLTPYVIPALKGNGAECFGVLDGNTLAAFCWYSTNPPERINDHWVVHFDPGCVYVYFVFTDPAYRGQRLLPHGIRLAMAEYARRGYPKLAAFVESANYDSLKSFYRMGFRDFGMIRAVKLFGKQFAYHGRGCVRFAFRVAPNADPHGRAVLSRTSAAAD